MGTEPAGFSERLMVVLTAKGLVDAGKANDVLAEAQKRRIMLEQVLAEKRLVSADKITEALADSFRLRPFFFKSKKPQPKALALLPFEKAWEYQVVPVALDDDGLHVVSSQPGNDFVKNFLQELTGQTIHYMISDRLSLRMALARYPGAEKYLSGAKGGGAPSGETAPAEEEPQPEPEEEGEGLALELDTDEAETPEPEAEPVSPEEEEESGPSLELQIESDEDDGAWNPVVSDVEDDTEDTTEMDPEDTFEMVSVEEEYQPEEIVPDLPEPELPEMAIGADFLEPELPDYQASEEGQSQTAADWDAAEAQGEVTIEVAEDEPVSEEAEPEDDSDPAAQDSEEGVETAARDSDEGGEAPSTLPPAPSSGLLAGRYLVGPKLMDGRLSTLFTARDQVTRRPVVLRRLEGSYSFIQRSDGAKTLKREARLQILREGRTLGRLRHRSLPRVRGVFEDEADIYLVLEEMQGQVLSELMERFGHPLPWELVRRYFYQLLSAVDYLHKQPAPIIHRDLRPETIILSPNGVMKIGEFGLAKMLDEDQSSGQTSFRSQGHPHYAAPEQLMGEPSHPRHDLYSIGAILYYIACNVQPPESMKLMYGQKSLTPLGELRPGGPEDLIQAIHVLLESEPENRPESASAVKALLGEEPDEARLPQVLLERQQMDEEPQSEDLAAAESQLSSVNVAAPEELAEEPSNKTQKRSMWGLLWGFRKKQEESEDKPLQLGDDSDFDGPSHPVVDLSTVDISRDLGQTLSEALCRTIDGVVIGRISETEITVACKDPSDVHIYDNIAMAAGGNFHPTLVKADPHLVDHALDFVFRSQHLSQETSWSVFLEQKALDAEVLQTTSQSASVNFGDEALEGPIVEAVDRLIKEAISAGASDIHLEPFETGMDVRYRIDGVLRKVNHFGPDDMSGIVKRIKVIGNMDIAQERVTQGGRISLKIGSREFDLRVSVVPVPVGESVVMRVLKKGAFTMTLSDLGFAEQRERRFREILSQPYGMILVCGPTGSGKSTTLYASLKEIARPDRKLLTVEDPIEYQMPGIIQVQVNTAPREEEKKVTFSRALREFLRQDPDVILVGEIRDRETAEIGIQAALTGHLLLSTIHTNDSIGIVARLRDMECEPFLIGSVLLGGLAQRLARRICPSCRRQIEIPPEYLHLFTDQGIKDPKAYKGTGCGDCNQIGTRGRVGLYELLEITPEIRALINRSAPEEELRETALSQGFQPLLADGIDKVQNGLVSLEEVLRVCKTV